VRRRGWRNGKRVLIPQWPLPFLARQKAPEIEDEGCGWVGGTKGKNTRSASQP